MSGDSEAARRYNTMTDKEWQQGYFDGETPPESETSDTSSSEDTHPSQPPTDSSHHDSSSNDSDSDEQASLSEDDKILIGEFAASAYQAQEDTLPLANEEGTTQSSPPKKSFVYVDLSPQVSDNENTTTKEIDQLQEK